MPPMAPFPFLPEARSRRFLLISLPCSPRRRESRLNADDVAVVLAPAGAINLLEVCSSCCCCWSQSCCCCANSCFFLANFSSSSLLLLFTPCCIWNICGCDDVAVAIAASVPVTGGAIDEVTSMGGDCWCWPMRAPSCCCCLSSSCCRPTPPPPSPSLEVTVPAMNLAGEKKERKARMRKKGRKHKLEKW